MSAIHDIIATLGYTPTMQQLAAYLADQVFTAKASKYLLFELSEITGEPVLPEHIQAVYPHKP